MECNGCHCHATDVADATPRRILMDEHRVIERVLDAVERMIDADVIDRPFLLDAVDFIRNFADGCHHAKEEDQLFPAMEQAGMPREGGPIGCMLHEHEQGREFVRRILGGLDAAAAGNPAAAAEVKSAALGYVGLLRQHIQKEDNILFVMAERLLDADAQKRLMQSFDRVEASTLGKHERYLALADRLSNWAFQENSIAT